MRHGYGTAKAIFMAISLAAATALAQGKSSPPTPLADLKITRVYAFPFEESQPELATISQHTYDFERGATIVTHEYGRARAMATFNGMPLSEIGTKSLCSYNRVWSQCRSGDAAGGSERVWSTAGKGSGWFVVNAVSENDPKNIMTRMFYIQ